MPNAHRGQILIVNLWASWCVPCLREVPDLLALQAELAAKGVTLLGVGMDEPAQLASLVEPFRYKHFPAFRTLLRATETMHELVSAIDPAWNEILPTAYILGRDGRLLQKVQGRKTREEFGQLLQQALASSPASR